MQDNIRIEKERKYWDKIALEYEHFVIEKETIKHPEDRMPILYIVAEGSKENA